MRAKHYDCDYCQPKFMTPRRTDVQESDIEHPFAIVTIGVSASGKTTWADDYVRKHPLTQIICRDDIRAAMVPNFTWREWFRIGQESDVTDAQRQAIERCSQKGLDVIIADTNLDRGHRDELAVRLAAAGYHVYYRTFPVTFKEAVRRDNTRANGVGAEVINKQFYKWYRFWDGQLPKRETANYIICDIDGTICLPSFRSPYNTAAALSDEPNTGVLAILTAIAEQHVPIEFASGRFAKFKGLTTSWLLNHGLQPDQFHLNMRLNDDRRHDDIIKLELLGSIRKAHNDCDPLLVIDDRPRVCRAWRRAGLKVLQFGDPLVEF